MRRRTVTTAVALVLSATTWLAACITPSTGATSPADQLGASAPPAAAPPADDPGEERAMARAGTTLDLSGGPGTPGLASVSYAATTLSSGTTPGTTAKSSQRTGRGYVDTAVENRLAGTRGWQTTRSTRKAVIEGYADSASTVAGRSVRLYVSSTARTFRVQLLRIGWYGGVGARQVWISTSVRGGVQHAARTNSKTRMIDAPWKVSAVLPTRGLVAGDYVAKLLGSDGASSFVPLTVREPRTVGAVLMVNSTLTWQAYNSWGGANTYSAVVAPTQAVGYAHRSVVASFDRPYARGSGAGDFFNEEYRLVVTAEHLGLRLNYAADLDLGADPRVLTGATGVALLGHSEYWSRAMRNALTTARDNGTNLAFLGANDIYRRVRFESSPLTGSMRHMVNYKDGNEDPVKTVDTTADWPYSPHSTPQSSITGVQYRCSHERADLVITDPNAWVFRGLGLQAGQRLPGMVGSEYDRVSLGLPTPRPIQIMAHSPITCASQPDFSDLVWYSTRSGAGVFAAGTLDWNAGIGASDALTRTVVTRVTERVFGAIAQARAGRRTPAADNALSFYTPNGVPLDQDGRPMTPAQPAAKSSTTD